jgi:parallel beta-helix repeat protein
VINQDNDVGWLGLVNSDNMRVENLIVEMVMLASTHNSRIENVIAKNSSWGIYLIFSDNNALSGNIVENNELGIVLNGSNNTISNNIVENNRLGISIYGSNNNTISNNVVENNYVGISLSWDSNNNTLLGNIIENNYLGIALVESNNNIIFNNVVENNFAGISLHESSNHNIIFRNRFSNNTDNNAHDSGTNRWDNNGEGNYWDDWQPPQRPDADGDGIVDEPRPIPGGSNFDNYPLVFPHALNQPPSAGFTFSPISPTTDNTVQFTDNSVDNDGTIVSWLWNFGDGTTSTSQNPTHRYSDAGAYTVTLTVTDNGGATGSVSKGITVGAGNIRPTASFVFTPSSPTTADVVQFTDNSVDNDGTIVSWLWNFGDGTTSTSQNPTHKYQSGGTYTVTLTVTDNGGATDEVSIFITINQTPSASFVYSPTYPTVDNAVQFTDWSTDLDGTIIAWFWDFGDGAISTSQNPTHQYAEKGTYTVTLTVTDNGGAVSSTSRSITVVHLKAIEMLESFKENLNERITKFEIRLQEDLLRMLDVAFMDERVGASVSVEMVGGTHVTTKEYQHQEIDIRVMGVSIGENIRVKVSSQAPSGRTILLHVDNHILPISEPWEIDVFCDGREVKPAIDYGDVLDPTNENVPEYLVLFGARGIQVLVSIPSFSDHTITIVRVQTEIPTQPPIGITTIAGIVFLITSLLLFLISHRMKE